MHLKFYMSYQVNYDGVGGVILVDLALYSEVIGLEVTS